MEKTRDLFRKIEGIRGTFHMRMSMIKNRNGKDSTEVEEVKKRWQEYTKNYTKKILMTQIAKVVWLLTYRQTSSSVKSSGL